MHPELGEPGDDGATVTGEASGDSGLNLELVDEHVLVVEGRGIVLYAGSPLELGDRGHDKSSGETGRSPDHRLGLRDEDPRPFRPGGQRRRQPGGPRPDHHDVNSSVTHRAASLDPSPLSIVPAAWPDRDTVIALCTWPGPCGGRGFSDVVAGVHPIELRSPHRRGPSGVR